MIKKWQKLTSSIPNHFAKFILFLHLFWHHNRKKLKVKLRPFILSEKIFGDNGGIDLGSGFGSPLDVDYNCEGSLGTLEFTEILDSLAYQIRSEQGPLFCTGSIVHAHWRYYHFDLLEAGLAPDIYTRSFIRYENDLPVYRLYKNIKNYFSVWGHASLYNYELYRQFWDAYDKAFPLLVKHFKKKFSISKKVAKSMPSTP